MLKILDRQGHPVPLGAQIGRGGEGSVYEVFGQAKVVAKVYHRSLTDEKSAKLTAMTLLYSERLRKVAAWPLDTLHESVGANACGLLMPRVDGLREVHELYGPKSRLTHFPNANWAFLSHTAMNTARAFAVLHAQSLVIGDVNQSNLLVSSQGTVTLIDCDSFQVTYQGQSYLCEVGVPTHTPPELQGQPFHGVTRTANHDNFGLAIIIFQLLFLGRHPFSGQYLGAGEMPIEKAISGYRFAYGPGAAAHQMKPPPATLPFSSVSDPIGKLFERAFSAKGVEASGRPRAEEWVSALVALGQNLTTCSRQPGHQYLSSLRSCPLCEIEGRSGLLLFHVASAGTTGGAGILDVEVVWAQILAVPHPGPLPTLSLLPLLVSPTPFFSFKPLPAVMEPAARVALSVDMQSISQKRSARRWEVAGIVALVGAISIPIGNSFATFYLMTFAFALAYTLIVVTFDRNVKIQVEVAVKVATEQYEAELASRLLEEQREADQKRKYVEKRQNLELAFNAAKKQYDFAQQQWEREGGSQAFDMRVEELKKAKKQMQDLTATLQKRLQQLEKEGAKRQLEKYLDRFKVQSATIDGIGQGRKATLQSYGVETAADVTESLILSIPGFGPSLSNTLMAWRQTHEAKFLYNPSLGVDPADKAVLEQEFTARRVGLEQELRNGPSSLQAIRRQILDRREVLRPGLEMARQLVISAHSDYQGLKQ